MACCWIWSKPTGLFPSCKATIGLAFSLMIRLGHLVSLSSAGAFANGVRMFLSLIVRRGGLKTLVSAGAVFGCDLVFAARGASGGAVLSFFLLAAASSWSAEWGNGIGESHSAGPPSLLEMVCDDSGYTKGMSSSCPVIF